MSTFLKFPGSYATSVLIKLWHMQVVDFKKPVYERAFKHLIPLLNSQPSLQDYLCSLVVLMGISILVSPLCHHKISSVLWKQEQWKALAFQLLKYMRWLSIDFIHNFVSALPQVSLVQLSSCPLYVTDCDCLPVEQFPLLHMSTMEQLVGQQGKFYSRQGQQLVITAPNVGWLYAI